MGDTTIECAISEITSLRTALAAAEKERDEARGMRIVRFDGREWTLAGEYAGDLARAFHAYLEHMEAENYVTLTFNAKADRPAVIVTIQRAEGATPHALRKQAETERDAALAALAEAREVLTEVLSAAAEVYIKCDGIDDTPQEERYLAAERRAACLSPSSARGRALLEVIEAARSTASDLGLDADAPLCAALRALDGDGGAP